MNEFYTLAADSIQDVERLRVENARLTAERDAAGQMLYDALPRSESDRTLLDLVSQAVRVLAASRAEVSRLEAENARLRFREHGADGLAADSIQDVERMRAENAERVTGSKG